MATSRTLRYRIVRVTGGAGDHNRRWKRLGAWIQTSARGGDTQRKIEKIKLPDDARSPRRHLVLEPDNSAQQTWRTIWFTPASKLAANGIGRHNARTCWQPYKH